MPMVYLRVGSSASGVATWRVEATTAITASAAAIAHGTARSTRREGGAAGFAAGSTTPSSISRSTSHASPMSRRRLRGSFSRQRRSRRASSPGSDAGNSPHGGASLITAASTSLIVSP